MSDGLEISYRPVGNASRAEVSVKADGQTLALDVVNLASAKARRQFAKAVTDEHAGIDGAELERQLCSFYDDLLRPPEPSGDTDLELDVSCIVRPELFHTSALSGIAIATTVISEGEPVGRWQLYVRWADGRRERCELSEKLELPDGGLLWIHPTPADPEARTRSGWSAAGRQAWLDGADAPNPAELFRQLCMRFEHFVDFSPDTGPGDVATLSIWALLSYAYPIWNAIPYVSVGGALATGKSRLFELLSRVVFRPVQSSSMTAPCLFRTLHESGGVLLMDEAERLRDSTPDAGELRSILLSGYKRGSPAKRLEPTADGRFRTRSFDVYGPKAIAGIAPLPEALASRCIRLTMFRATPDSAKPRRRIDESPAVWSELRDGLHAIALEHGRSWLQLAGRTDVCPAMSGRDYELWAPLLALAAWLQEHGADGLLGLMQEHAMRTVNLGRDDSTQEPNEILLRLLAEAVSAGTLGNLTRNELLRRAKEREPEIFMRWQGRRVSSILQQYRIRPSKSHGQRTYGGVTVDALRRIELAYGLDLGLPSVPSVQSVPQPAPVAQECGNRGAQPVAGCVASGGAGGA